jgi:tRNA pseudouridine55 synthase
MFLLHHKATGVSSFHALWGLKHQLHTKELGHSGTLDPFASGLLLVAVGRYTKLLPYLVNTSKKYRVTICIWSTSDTGDRTGNISFFQSPLLSDLQNFISIAETSFVGKIQQIPPMYSAVKIDGKRAYEYARAWITVDRRVREVEIYSYENWKFLSNEQLQFEVHVSSGTYIRTLVEDIWKILGWWAYVQELERFEISGLQNMQDISVETMLWCSSHECSQEQADRLAFDGLYPGELQRSIHWRTLITYLGEPWALVDENRSLVNIAGKRKVK